MSTPEHDEVLAWAQGHLAGLLATTPESLDPRADFDALGVDSALAVSLLMEIEDRYGVDLPPESLFENPTLAAVVDTVVAQRAGAAAPQP